MTKNEFSFIFKNYNFIVLKDNYIINRKPLYITTFNSDEKIKFKNVDELFNHKIENTTIGDIVKELDTIGDIVLTGGRGAGSISGSQTYTFGHAAGGSGHPITSAPNPLVAEANTKIKTKTQGNALKWFSNTYKNSDTEFAVEVDDNGFVHQHVRGDKTSVAIASSSRRRKGVRNTMIFHNHPSGGHFSDNDLLSTSIDRNSRGIVAAGNKFNYIFKKQQGNKFKASQFAKAVKSAKMKGKSYDDAVHNWLKNNQKKYGYTYTREAVK